jgi:rhodanese-related sulfurtransferase
MQQDVKVVHLDIQAVKSGLADGSMLVVDVREPHEFAMGRIPGSVSHPLSSFSAEALPEAAGRRIVFSCAAGVRSMQALAIVQSSGLGLSEHYRGGFKEWALAGEPVEA